MKLWIDDVRPAPEGYDWCKSVNEAIETIKIGEKNAVYATMTRQTDNIVTRWWPELIDIDSDFCDAIHLLDWLEETSRNYPIRIHSANPVGVANMRRIIERNGWKEVK
jgi:hypothetical protein